MKYNFYKKSKSLASLVIFTMALSFASCNKSIDIFDLDINTDPNSPTKGTAELLLPEAERNLAGFIQGLSNTQMGFLGVLSSSDSYGLAANSFYGSWSNFYTGPGKDLEEVIVASKLIDNKPYLGIAQVLKAYSFSTIAKDLQMTLISLSETYLHLYSPHTLLAELETSQHLALT